MLVDDGYLQAFGRDGEPNLILELRELLVAARKKAGMTQAEVAEVLGRPQSFVAKYEGGERRLDVIEFMLVARIVGADPAKIMRALS